MPSSSTLSQVNYSKAGKLISKIIQRNVSPVNKNSA